ncbi:MAG: hypothetical protein WB870_16160 [Gallionellaceae bacterium]
MTSIYACMRQADTIQTEHGFDSELGALNRSRLLVKLMLARRTAESCLEYS